MRALLALSVVALLSAPSLAQEASPEGTWRDDFGTTLQFSFCGDGTQLCAVLIDVQGKSRTPANLAYVNQQVAQANLTGQNEWQGAVVIGGTKAAGTITQVSTNTLEIQGCKFGLLCQTIEFDRV